MMNASDQDQNSQRASDADRMSALFAGLVLNHTQMALLLLGHAPHPKTGERVQDLDGARMLIDQLEMLEQKTQGNLVQHELQMLRESLTALRMAFVDAANAPTAGADTAPAASAARPAPSGSSASAPAGSKDGAPDEETRKKFSKKY
jgi:hypothetical protein